MVIQKAVFSEVILRSSNLTLEEIENEKEPLHLYLLEDVRTFILNKAPRSLEIIYALNIHDNEVNVKLLSKESTLMKITCTV